VRDLGHSRNGEEVVMDTGPVVVGTSQESRGPVGCQPIREGKRRRRGRPKPRSAREGDRSEITTFR